VTCICIFGAAALGGAFGLEPENRKRLICRSEAIGRAAFPEPLLLLRRKLNWRLSASLNPPLCVSCSALKAAAGITSLGPAARPSRRVNLLRGLLAPSALMPPNDVMRGIAPCRWEPDNPTLFLLDSFKEAPPPPLPVADPLRVAPTQWGPPPPGPRPPLLL